MFTELSTVELEAEVCELIPAREALALVQIGNITNVVAVNTAIAFNVLSMHSSASAGAGQFISLQLS
jgi:hypothetical protein